MSLPDTFLAGLAADVGADFVRTQMPDRDAYARDLWPRAQLERLTGEDPTRPDAIVWPGTAEEVAKVVKRAAQAGVPVVPFGAGSGVCGAARPTHGGIVVDLKRLKTVWSIDDGLLDVGAGINGELLERRLEREGMTLGHFPSSILCSTVGGWLAGRSAGQCSSRYGKIEDMIVNLQVVTGDGEIRWTQPSDVAQGLDWNQIFVGSEGTLGLITRARLKLHPQPAHRAFRGYMMPDIDAGLAVMRGVMQAGRRPAVLRMYDALDTLMVGSDPDAPRGGPLSKLKDLLLGGHGGGKQRAMTAILGRPSIVNALVDRIPPKALLVTVCEGTEAEAAADDALIADLALAAGGQDLGEAPGRAWLAHRYDVSYKQSTLYAGGAFVDTFEVATTWSKVAGLYAAVRDAVGEHVVVMAHFSHAYPGGCSIYFTFAGAGPDREAQLRRYDAAWQAGLDTVVAFDAAIAHHHGAGLSRRSHMGAEHGPAAAWFRALKAALDPHGILNPGKLFTEADR